jgi:hypothetical protein
MESFLIELHVHVPAICIRLTIKKEVFARQVSLCLVISDLSMATMIFSGQLGR